MHPFFEKIERVNSRLIPYAIALLLLVIIYEIFFHIENHALNLTVEIVDGMIIAIFVVDLIFLARKAKSVQFFFRNYWLDILAVLPFTLIFNLVNRVYRLLTVTEQLAIGQAVVHEGLEARKGLGAFLREEKIAALFRGERLAKGVRIGARILRVVTKSRLFTHVHKKHHEAHRNMKAGKTRYDLPLRKKRKR